MRWSFGLVEIGNGIGIWYMYIHACLGRYYMIDTAEWELVVRGKSCKT